MAQLEVSIDRDEIQKVIQGDRGLADLVEQVLNELLEAEITEHLGAERHERNPERRGRRGTGAAGKVPSPAEEHQHA